MTGLDKAEALGHRLVILVGDEPYYARVGFKRVPDGRIELPGPVDPDRLLYLELTPGALAAGEGPGPAAASFRGTVSGPRGTTWRRSAISSRPRLPSVENSGSSCTARTRCASLACRASQPEPAI